MSVVTLMTDPDWILARSNNTAVKTPTATRDALFHSIETWGPTLQVAAEEGCARSRVHAVFTVVDISKSL